MIIWIPPTKNLRLFLGQKIEIENWSAYWVSINWSSPELSQESWQSYIINTRHYNYHHLENVLEFSNLGKFLYYFEVDNFIKFWPKIRIFCPQRLFFSRKLFDAMWTFAYSKYPMLIPPLPTFFELSNLEKKLLVYICNHPLITKDKIHLDSKLDLHVIETMLIKLIKLNYLVEFNGQYVRSSYYATYQAERPQKKIIYTVNNIRKTFTTSKNW